MATKKGGALITINILGVDFTIRDVDDNCRTDDCMGRSDSKHMEIVLSRSLNDDGRRLTLLHEVIHILSDNLALKLSEEQVTALSTGLYHVIKTNEVWGGV